MKIISLLLLFIPFSFTQNISNSRVKNIINNLLTDSTKISDYIFPDEFNISNRFGIEYKRVKNKFLIANDFPSELSKYLANNNNKYEYQFENLGDNFSSLTISAPTLNITRKYFLKDSLIISKPYFYSQNWKTTKSDHFKFFISDDTLLYIDTIPPITLLPKTYTSWSEHQVHPVAIMIFFIR